MKASITKVFLVTLLATTTLLVYAQKTQTNNANWDYPKIEGDTVCDFYFGQKITDPFRNIENSDNQEVKEWTEDQKDFYDSLMVNISGRDSLIKEIESYKKTRDFWSEIPRQVGEKLFFSMYDYNQERYSLNYKNTYSDTTIELFSLDSLNSADSLNYSIDYFEPSLDGNFVAIAVSFNGTENSTIYVLDVKKRQLLSDKITNARSGNPQWLKSNDGFLYQKYIKYSSGTSDEAQKKEISIRLHYLGNNSENDKEVFSKKVSTQLDIHEIDFPLIFLSQSSNITLAALNHGTEPYSTLYYSPINELLTKSPEKIDWKLLFDRDDLVTNYYLVNNDLYYLSFKDNPMGQVIKRKLKDPKSNKILFEGKESSLKEMVVNRNSIFIKSYENSVYKLTKIKLGSEEIEKVKLPFDGTIYLRPSFNVSDFYQNSDCLFFKYQSWNQDQCILKFHTDSLEVEITDILPQNPNSSIEGLTIKVVDVPSHDGVLVPMTLFYNSDLVYNSENPVIIEAYGCYGSIFPPYFSGARKAWLNRGGVFAIAHVRGGGEKGYEWYQDGYKETKPNSWKDLIYCSEYLIENKFTSSSKLAVVGTSCGGITVGRAITERPDLFKSAVISVARLNTVRHEVGDNNSGIAEYGTVKDSVDFNNILEMDVYHHIKDGVTYPSILFSIGVNDSRVSPWQSSKTVARLQNNKQDNNIFLLHITNEGHGGFSESADSYSFLLWQMGYPEFKYSNDLQN